MQPVTPAYCQQLRTQTALVVARLLPPTPQEALGGGRGQGVRGAGSRGAGGRGAGGQG